MNTEVEIHVGERRSVVAVPYSALRTQRDVASAAEVLGLDPAAVQQQLAASTPQAPAANRDSASMGGGTGSATATATRTFTTPDGRTINLPDGVTGEQVMATFRKRFSGGTLTDAEQKMMAQVRAANPNMMGGGAGGGGQGRPGGATGRLRNFDPGSYIVFALKDGSPTALNVRTGLTDMDYMEILGGLSEGDTVLVLPSSGLLSSQREMRERFQRMTGGGGLPGVQQTTTTQQRPQTAAPR